MTETPITSIAQAIQLAIAPVFLLTAVGTLMSVLSGRLARIVDRMRALEAHVCGNEHEALEIKSELEALARRMGMSYLAIGLAVVCALLIALLIVLAFTDVFLEVSLARVIGILFMAAMIAFIASLLAFLREIFLAVTTARNAMRLRLPNILSLIERR